MISKRLATLLCVCVLSLGSAKPAEPTTNPAVAHAQSQHESALGRAKQEFVRAVNAADKKLMSELNSALKSAVNAKDLEAVERISAVKKDAEKAIQARAAGEDQESPDFAGKWRVLYEDGALRIYTVDHNGTVSLAAEESSGQLRNGVLNLGDRKLERWSMIKGMVLVEHFDPAVDFPIRPRKSGLGVRVQ